MKNALGYSLLELMIVLALVSIVFSIAIPSMRTFTQNDRLTTNINVMVGHLAYARSEAVKRSQQVSVCVSNNQTSCTGGSWEEGWLIYIDADADNAFTAGEEILRVQQALDGNNAVTTTLGTQVTYDYRGFTNTTGTMLLCDDRSGDFGKTLTVSNTGRVRTSRDSTC
jgi:type IV fimbrial biogenesis protein FimT